MRRLFAGACLFAVLGVSLCGYSKNAQAEIASHSLRAATWEDLLNASCAVYLGDYPYGSGVLLGVDSPNHPPKVCLLTAAHVALYVLDNSTNSFRIATVDSRGKHSVFLETMIRKDKCRLFLPYDLFAIDVTEDIVRFAREHNGVSLEYISVNAPNVSKVENDDWWCGVLKYADFSNHDIRLGSPCKWIGSNVWMWNRFNDKMESSLCVFDGAIAALPHSPSRVVTHAILTNSYNVFVSTIPAIHGMSGGPVFAKGKAENGLEYPYLIGIGVCRMITPRHRLLSYNCDLDPEVAFHAMTNFTAFTNHVSKFEYAENDGGSYICPIDALLDFLDSEDFGDKPLEINFPLFAKSGKRSVSKLPPYVREVGE